MLYKTQYIGVFVLKSRRTIVSKMVVIRAKLLHPKLTEGETIRIMDADVARDDLLTTVFVQADGVIEALFDLDNAKSADSPFEWAPDVYFEWLRDEEVIAKSDVFPNVDFFARHPVTGLRHDGTVDLGEIRLNE